MEFAIGTSASFGYSRSHFYSESIDQLAGLASAFWAREPKIRTAAMVFAILIVVGLVACEQPESIPTVPSTGKTTSVLQEFSGPVSAGVAITFDDSYVEEWYAIRDLLSSYGARATFFVTRFDYLSAEQVGMLGDLQKDGHEIAAHGLRHKGVDRDYQSDPLKIEQYLEEEILPSIEAMDSEGFKPSAFAYPLGERTEDFDQALLTHFSVVRGTSYPREDVPISEWDEIYHGCGDTDRVVFGVGMDESYGHTLEQLTAGLKRASERREVVVLYGHEPSDLGGDYQTSIERLRDLLRSASRLELRYYTISQLPLMGEQDC